MTTALQIAVLGALLAGLIQAVILDRGRPRLRLKEQFFKFHELRDKLQALAMDGKIRPDSMPYRILFTIINLSIRNPGVMKLRDVLKMSNTVKHQVEGNTFEQLQAELRSYPAEAQALASDVFSTFALMLVVNDDITYWLFALLKSVAKLTNAGMIRLLKLLAKTLSPKRIQIVREARNYERLGRRLVPSF